MSGWTLFPHLVVRTTGFSFDLLEQLRFSRAAEAARRAAQERQALEALRAQGPRLHRPSRGLLAALKAGRPVEESSLEAPERFADYNRHARAAQAAEEEFERAWAEEEERVRAVFASTVASPRFREAVASSSPPVYLDLVRGGWSARLERQVASYLQRVCAKNETMSFFGPINYGRLEPAGFDGVEVRWSGPLALRGRRSYAASWLVTGLMRAMAWQPEVAPWLVLRRKAFRKPPLKPVEQGADSPEALLPRLVEEADGVRRLPVLAQALGVEPSRLVAAAQLACERGLLTHQLEVSATVHQPLEDLVERLAGIPGEAPRALVREVETLLAQLTAYSEADAAAKVALNAQVGQHARERWGLQSPTAPREQSPAVAGREDTRQMRGEGHNFYQDRLPLREECGGDLRVVLSGARARELQTRVTPALELMAEAAWRTRAAARRALGELVGARTVPFWKVVAAYAQRPIPHDQSVLAELQARLGDTSRPAVELGPVALTPADGDRRLPVVASLDLLVAAASPAAWAEGDYTLVIGDVHDTVLVWGWALQFHEARREVERQMLGALGQLQRAIPVVTILPSRRTGLIPSEFPGPVVELGSVSGRPSSWQLPMDDLVVASDGKEARLLSTRLGSEVCLYNGELESLVHTAFALPRIRPLRLSGGAHTPRLTVGGVVVQREQWSLDEEGRKSLLAARDDRARLRTALALWQRLGMPDQVFAKFKDERKPILVDVQSPPLLRVFLNLLEQRGEVSFGEMLPGPHQLWLQGPQGRHTAELRCSFLLAGEGLP